MNLSFNVEHRDLLAVKTRARGPFPKYNPIEIIPSVFWVSKVIRGSLPANSYYRYRTANKILMDIVTKYVKQKNFITITLKKTANVNFVMN